MMPQKSTDQKKTKLRQPRLSAERPAQLIEIQSRPYLGLLLPAYLILAPTYAVWRIHITNWHIWYGPLMLGAELYGILTTVLFLAIARKILVPISRPSKARRTVDILITTFNEPLAIIEPTIRAAMQVKGANSVLVLDDGNRPEVKALARKLKARYYFRTTNTFAKAGNLNHGLEHSKAEFVLCLDVDHIPSTAIIERLIGYFDDPLLGFVQTPQAFYNQDSFLFRPRRKGLWSEQQMFYDVIQPAKNRYNAAFFVGTNAILRRRALDAVGGFATGTATEDIHTSLRLHARGWRSLFIPEILASGLEAANLKEFYKQRRRWAAGSLGLLMRSPDSPLRARGLSLAQRLNYLSATLAHLQGVQKLVFLLIPLFVLFWLQSPLTISYGWLSLVLLGYLGFSLGITAAYARGTYHLLYTEAYSLANFMAHFSALWGVVKVQKKFAVSNKIVKPNERTWLKAVIWSLLLLSLMGTFRAAALLFGAGATPRHAGLVISCLVFLVWYVICQLIFIRNLSQYERREPVDIPRLKADPFPAGPAKALHEAYQNR